MGNIKYGHGLSETHFDSKVARSVFNDKGQQAVNPMVRRAEIEVARWTDDASPRSMAKLVGMIDRHLFPFMSPMMMRNLALLVCTKSPHLLTRMPNTAAYVTALTRAIHLSKFLQPAAIKRILIALEMEGLSIGGNARGREEE